MSRFSSYVRRHHIGLLALFVAMGGTSYAAFKLPKNSVGAKQIKANAVNSSKVANRSLLAGDFKAGQLPAGAQGIQGLKGDKGDPCPASDPNCKGPKGDTGAQGPGALSFDGQFPTDTHFHRIALVNGVEVSIYCDPGNNITLQAEATDTAHNFYGWGTTSHDGGPPTAASVNSPVGSPPFIFATGGNAAELGLVVHSTAPGDPIKWTRVDALGIMGSVCNYHALIIPSS